MTDSRGRFEIGDGTVEIGDLSFWSLISHFYNSQSCMNRAFPIDTRRFYSKGPGSENSYNFREKRGRCSECGVEIIRRIKLPKRCESCTKRWNTVRAFEWTKNHTEENRQRARDWYWKNRKRAISRQHQYSKDNPEKIKQWKKVYLSNPKNKERYDDLRKKWAKSHPHSRHHILSKSESKRERGLPTEIILGEPFEGSHLHHLNPHLALYIPDYIHHSVYHNIWTGQGMAEINSRAWAFYEPNGEILPI